MSSKYYLWKLIATVGITFGLAVTSIHAAENGMHTHEHGKNSAKPTLNNGKKWETDAALRRGMQNIRTTMQASLPEIHEGKLSNTQYDEIARKISDEVGYVVANCKLEPQADAQLHLVIADIMDGVDVMRGKVAQAKRQAGAVQVLDALDKYATYFHHPGWTPIRHGEN